MELAGRGELGWIGGPWSLGEGGSWAPGDGPWSLGEGANWGGSEGLGAWGKVGTGLDRRALELGGSWELGAGRPGARGSRVESVDPRCPRPRRQAAGTERPDARVARGARVADRIGGPSLSASAKTGRRDGATGCGVTGCGAYEPPAPTFSLGLGVGAILFNSPLTSPRPPANWMTWPSIRA